MGRHFFARPTYFLPIPKILYLMDRRICTTFLPISSFLHFRGRYFHSFTRCFLPITSNFLVWGRFPPPNVCPFCNFRTIWVDAIQITAIKNHHSTFPDREFSLPFDEKPYYNGLIRFHAERRSVHGFCHRKRETDTNYIFL